MTWARPGNTEGKHHSCQQALMVLINCPRETFLSWYKTVVRNHNQLYPVLCWTAATTFLSSACPHSCKKWRPITKPWESSGGGVDVLGLVKHCEATSLLLCSQWLSETNSRMQVFICPMNTVDITLQESNMGTECMKGTTHLRQQCPENKA